MDHFDKGLAKLAVPCNQANLALAKKRRFLVIAEKRWNRHWQKNGGQKNGAVRDRRGLVGALEKAAVTTMRPFPAASIGSPILRPVGITQDPMPENRSVHSRQERARGLL